MQKGLYYLAVPYTGTPIEQQTRVDLSLKAAVEFLQQGIHVFAPLIYVNPIANELQGISKDERRNIVMPYLFEFLQSCQGLILLTAEGWEASWGVLEEVRFCERANIPIYLLAPEHLSGDLAAHLNTPLTQEKRRNLFAILEQNVISTSQISNSIEKRRNA